MTFYDGPERLMYEGRWKDDRINGLCYISRAVSTSEKMAYSRKIYIHGLEIDENIQDWNKDTTYMMVSILLMIVFISVALC